MRRWAYRRAMRAALGVASATLLLAGAATVLNVSHAASAASHVLADPRGSAAATDTLAGTLQHAGVPDEQAIAAAGAVLADPHLMSALEQAAVTGDGAQLTGTLVAAALPVDERLANTLSSVVERLAPAGGDGPTASRGFLGRSPAVWALKNADTLVPAGAVVALALLGLLMIWKLRPTVKAAGHWAMGLAGVWLVLVLAAPAVILSRTTDSRWVLGALTTQHLGAPLVLPLAALFAAGLAATLLSQWHASARLPRQADSSAKIKPGPPVHRVSPHVALEPPLLPPAPVAVTPPRGGPVPPVPAAAVGSELFDPVMGAPARR